MKVYKNGLVADATKYQLEALLAGGWALEPTLKQEEPAQEEPAQDAPVPEIKNLGQAVVKRKLNGK